jgi:translation initiation factor 2B subunit (eIF-2B alpha/beta/delta family)
VKTFDELVIELEEQRRLQQQLRQQQQQVEEAQPRPVSLYDFIDLIPGLSQAGGLGGL